MTINNITTLLPLMNFDDEDEFYHLQIIKRKKENPELGSNAYVVKTYYLQHEQYLLDKMPEIISLCDLHNARAYLNLSPRSFEKTAFNALKKLSDCIMNRDYKAVRKSYESVAGSHGNGKRKKWVVDVDYTEEGFNKEYETKYNAIEKLVLEAQEEAQQTPIAIYVPTKNGAHIITNPFDVRKIKVAFPDVDLHKNNPTILYMKG